MTVVAVLLGMGCIYLMINKILVKREVQRMAREIEQINASDSNCKLTVQIPDPALAELAVSVNNLRQIHHDKVAAYIRSEEEYKQSMADISHDLRTPLTAMKGYLKLLRREDLDPVKQREYVEIAYDKTDTLNYLVKSLFELARLECHAYHFEWEQVNIREVMEQELVLFYPEFERQGIEPEVLLDGAEMWITADSAAVSRIFSNVIQNALYHGSGSIQMRAWAEDKRVNVEISNAAPNLVKGDVERLFTRTYTADPARSRSGGGLGLSIVKAFTEQMGGMAEAELKEGRICIAVKFPLSDKELHWV